jgi:predicted DNA-binding protein
MVKKISKSDDRHKGVPLGLRISPEEDQALETIAKKERRTKTEVVKWALYLYAKEHSHDWPEPE